MSIKTEAVQTKYKKTGLSPVFKKVQLQSLSFVISPARICYAKSVAGGPYRVITQTVQNLLTNYLARLDL